MTPRRNRKILKNSTKSTQMKIYFRNKIYKSVKNSPQFVTLQKLTAQL